MDNISALARELLNLFARGEMSATNVHRLASAAWQDGWGRDCPLAQKLMTAMGGGSHSGNITRGLMKAAKECGLLSTTAQPYEVDLPGGAGKMGMFLPHEILFHTDAQGIFLSEAQLQADCLGRLLREWAAHPDVMFAGDLTQVAALGFHCDGVQYTSTMRAGGGRSVIVGSINIISGQSNNIKNTRHPLFVLRKERLCKCGCQGYHSFQAILEVVAWSMRCLLAGESPRARHDGHAWHHSEVDARLPHGIALPHAAMVQVSVCARAECGA